jgi:DNA-binding response OmpR family regulator
MATTPAIWTCSRSAPMNLEAQGRRAVIADADRAVLELLQVRLDLAGYRTFLARTGPAAIEAVRTARPAVLILDLNLPELDGLEVLRQLNPKKAPLPYPILLMGRRLDPETVREAAGYGIKGALAKPFSGADLVERVARLFRPPTPVQAPAARPAAALI